MARDFRKIKAWQLAEDLTVMVYSATKRFPREEIYGITSQLRRAASSVPANIVEGANRATKKDYVHFLNLSWASLAEAQYFLHLSKRLGYLAGNEYEKLENLRRETASTLYGLVKAVESQTNVGGGDTGSS